MKDPNSSSAGPKHVEIGPLTYTICTDAAEIRRHSDSANIAADAEWSAFSDHDSLVIGINGTNPDQVQKRDLVHELLHCCLRVSGVEPNAYARIVGRAKGRHDGYTVEEFVVAAQAAPLLTVLRTNPELVAWLTAEASR